MTALTVAAVAAVVLLSTHCALEERMNTYQVQVPVTEPDLSRVPDGAYIGKAANGVVRVKVRVTVSSSAIRNIEILRHFNGQGEAAEAIVGDVIAAQSLQVDLVSGASYSSKVILKAVEDALIKAL